MSIILLIFYQIFTNSAFFNFLNLISWNSWEYFLYICVCVPKEMYIKSKYISSNFTKGLTCINLEVPLNPADYPSKFYMIKNTKVGAKTWQISGHFRWDAQIISILRCLCVHILNKCEYFHMFLKCMSVATANCYYWKCVLYLLVLE